MVHRRPPVLSSSGLATLLGEIVPTRHVPLLVIRLPELERLAWREGRAAARRLERHARRAFAEVAAQVLRESDIVAHDPESEYFAVALAGATRAGGTLALPADCRATLIRMVGALESELRVPLESGWTVVSAVDDHDLAAELRTALERGARERERYDFFSTVGHELRTPLTSIRGYLETLIEESLDAPTARHFLEVARNETLRLSRLVEGMFDISLLDATAALGVRAALDAEATTSVGPALEAALASLAPRAREHCVSVAVENTPSAIVGIGYDRLVQVFVNVIVNAIEHGRRGGRIEISGRLLGTRCFEIDVDDDGPGISPSERDAIFGIGYRSRAAYAEGSGLGLALVRRLLDRAGGGVVALEAPLGGARIRIRLPLRN